MGYGVSARGRRLWGIRQGVVGYGCLARGRRLWRGVGLRRAKRRYKN